MRLLFLAPALLLAAATPSAWGAGTAAGTTITNTATATYTDPGGVVRSEDSNTHQLQVDEVLDVTVVSSDGGPVTVNSPATGQVLRFTVRNTGNGPEVYRLTAVAAVGGNAFDASIAAVWLDDGDGVLETGAGGDTLLDPGVNDPLLAADAPVLVFVVGDIPASRADGDLGNVRLEAEAATARSTPARDPAGTAFAGAGEGGSDAVVGSSEAFAAASNGYLVSQASATFTKSSTVLDPFGGSNAIPGAVITYTLSLQFNGSGTVTGAGITDPIPAGTTYVDDSLTLGGLALTEEADADAGVFTGTRIEVDLGDVAAPATRVVTFQVTVTP